MLSYAVDVTHNSPRPAPSAATTKSRPVTRLFPPPISKILIANPRLEFPPTHSKQTPLTFSNRDYIAVFQVLPSRRQSENRPRPLTRVTPSLPTRNSGLPAAAGVPLAPLTHGRAFRTAGIPAGSFAFSRLITHHSSLITALLIYGPAIRIPRNSLKT